MTKDEYIKPAEATAEAAYKRCADKHIPEILRRETVQVVNAAFAGIAASAVFDRDLRPIEFKEISDTCKLLSRAFTDHYGAKKGVTHAGA